MTRSTLSPVGSVVRYRLPAFLAARRPPGRGTAEHAEGAQTESARIVRIDKMDDMAKRNFEETDAVWPEPVAENRPWTRWWWFAGAVDRSTITQLLEAYSEAGLGGVEITSIYGVRGTEAHRISYLSAEWLAMLRHAISEAERLGMKVDLPPGSGWRMGGDFISDTTSAAKLDLARDDTTGAWQAECQPTEEQVKRAGPGGKGRAFNPFSRTSLQAVIDHFTPAFKELDIRAQFHDSWEYRSDCCPEFFECFSARRGYELREYLAELAGEGDADRAARVRSGRAAPSDRAARPRTRARRSSCQFPARR